MNSDFAAAMRRALDHTRAQDVWKATNVIQATFAGTPAPTTDDGVPLDVEPPRPQQRPRLRLIDPDAEIVEPEAELRSISDRPATAKHLPAGNLLGERHGCGGPWPMSCGRSKRDAWHWA